MADPMRWLYAHYIKPEIENSGIALWGELSAEGR